LAAIAERLEEVAARVDLDQADLARMLETDPRTVSRWLKKQTAPRSTARERLLEVIVVLERLSTVLRPDVAHDWLFTPNRSLGYRKPIDLLREGEFRPVLGAIEALAEGVFV
jgi:putative toxin-antitoxin system antitoxin component (TIGR02293 family)